MIIVDLVEMKDPLHKKEVYEYAKALLEAYEDHRTKVYPLTERFIEANVLSDEAELLLTT